MKRLINIQNALIAPKDQQTKESKRTFKYRTAEDILKRAKPLCRENNLSIIMKDDIIGVGERYFLKATASLYTESGDILAQSSACAELDDHSVVKDGITVQTMSKEQATGSASSYARKYALCGLFAIDDSEQDPDDGFLELKGAIENIETEEDLKSLWEDRCKNHKRKQELSVLVKAKIAYLKKKDVATYKPEQMPSLKISGNVIKPQV